MEWKGPTTDPCGTPRIEFAVNRRFFSLPTSLTFPFVDENASGSIVGSNPHSPHSGEQLLSWKNTTLAELWVRFMWRNVKRGCKLSDLFVNFNSLQQCYWNLCLEIQIKTSVTKNGTFTFLHYFHFNVFINQANQMAPEDFSVKFSLLMTPRSSLFWENYGRQLETNTTCLNVNQILFCFFKS